MIANKDGGAVPRPSESLTARRSMHRPAGLPHDALESALERTTDWLLARQADEGYWVGELEGDTILESEYILLLAFLGRESDPVCGQMRLHPGPPARRWRLGDLSGGPDRRECVGQGVFRAQAGRDGAGRPGDGAARQAILAAGGAHQCNSFTRFYLALLGQIGYDECPCVPPELVLIPSRWSFSLSAMSAWTRTIVVPLSIMSYFKPVRVLAPERGIGELFRSDQDRPSRRTARWVSWTNFFLGVDSALKWLDRWAPAAWRQPAIRGGAPLDARAL